MANKTNNGPGLKTIMRAEYARMIERESQERARANRERMERVMLATIPGAYTLPETDGIGSGCGL